MLTAASRRLTVQTKRRGFTLAELLIVLTLGGIVLGIAYAVGARLQRQLQSEATRFAADRQLAAGTEVLPIDLRGLSPTSGDIAVAGARDTSLEIRAPIGNGVVCGISAGTITLALHRGPMGQAIAPRATAGDTLWLLDDAAGGERWRASALTSLRRASGICAALDTSAEQVFDRTHLWIAEVGDVVTAEVGAVVRITRPERFSFYRASDGQWYLGLRTWNAGIGAFNGVQPLSGPYRSPVASYGARFRYFDAGGAAVPSGAADSHRIARIEALLATDRLAGAVATSIDSLTIVVGLRNRNE